MWVFGNILIGVAQALDMILTIVMWVVFIRVVISWFNPDPYNPLTRILSQISDPIISVVQRKLPMNLAPFAPMFVFILIVLLNWVVVENIRQLGMELKFKSRTSIQYSIPERNTRDTSDSDFLR